MEIKDKRIYFDNDDEFFDYCIRPQISIIRDNDSYYSDLTFTDQYNNAINDGITFVIKDEDSQIYKHGAVSYRTLSKEISNLEPWFDDEDDIDEEC